MGKGRKVPTYVTCSIHYYITSQAANEHSNPSIADSVEREGETLNAQHLELTGIVYGVLEDIIICNVNDQHALYQSQVTPKGNLTPGVSNVSPSSIIIHYHLLKLSHSNRKSHPRYSSLAEKKPEYMKIVTHLSSIKRNTECYYKVYSSTTLLGDLLQSTFML